MFNGNRFGVLAVLFLVIGFFGCYHSKIAVAGNAPTEDSYPSLSPSNRQSLLVPRGGTPVPVEGKEVDKAATDIREDETESPTAPPQAVQLAAHQKKEHKEQRKREVALTPEPSALQLKSAAGVAITTNPSAGAAESLETLEMQIEKSKEALDTRKKALDQARLNYRKNLESLTTIKDSEERQRMKCLLIMEDGKLGLEVIDLGATRKKVLGLITGHSTKTAELKSREEGLVQVRRTREEKIQKAKDLERQAIEEGEAEEAKAIAKIAETKAAIIELNAQATRATTEAQSKQPIEVKVTAAE